MLEFLIRATIIVGIYLILVLNKYTTSFMVWFIQITPGYSLIEHKFTKEKVAKYYKLCFFSMTLIGYILAIIEEVIVRYF